MEYRHLRCRLRALATRGKLATLSDDDLERMFDASCMTAFLAIQPTCFDALALTINEPDAGSGTAGLWKRIHPHSRSIWRKAARMAGDRVLSHTGFREDARTASESIISATGPAGNRQRLLELLTKP